MGVGSLFNVRFLIVFIIIITIFVILNSKPHFINKSEVIINDDPGGSPDEISVKLLPSLNLYNNAFPCNSCKSNFVENSTKPKAKAEPNAAPFVATFLLKNKHIFDGVIVYRGVVLTAHHNLTNYENEIGEIKIYAGHSDNSNLNLPEIQQRKIQSFKFLKEKDLVLIFLDKPFTFNKYITAASLPEDDFCQPGQEAISFTFGPCSQKYFESTEMHAVPLKILTQNNCFSEHEHIYTNHLFCASDHWKFAYKSWTFFCKGDSGSPLIMMIRGIPTLVGVFVGGKKGCTQRSVIFQNVFFVKEWIKDQCLRNG